MFPPDLGYMINYAMFQRNGKAGYVLKPVGLRSAEKAQLLKVRKYRLVLTVGVVFYLVCETD